MKKQHSAIEVRALVHQVHQLVASSRSTDVRKIEIHRDGPTKCCRAAGVPSPLFGSFQARPSYGANRARNRASESACNSLTSSANRVTHDGQS